MRDATTRDNGQETTATRCPHCDSIVDIPLEIADNNIECPLCQGVFTAHFSEYNDDAEPPQPLPSIIESQENLLSQIESLLRRMIIGIPRFVFIEVPRTVWQLWCRTFPTVVKLTRITVLFITWTALAFWPLLLAPAFLRFVPLPSFFSWSFNEPGVWWADYLFWLWVPLALIGSVWGVFNIVLKKRRRLKNGHELAEDGMR